LKEVFVNETVVRYAHKNGATEIRDVPVSKIDLKDVLVRVVYVGICGSNLNIHHNNFIYPVEVPLILGHEFSGIIEKVGSEVHRFNVGERVTAETHAKYCGECFLCRTKNFISIKKGKDMDLE
jgi:D-arabinose 1-dehydrogenase-like Zn-dependent alcohol dehydrogenase